MDPKASASSEPLQGCSQVQVVGAAARREGVESWHPGSYGLAWRRSQEEGDRGGSRGNPPNTRERGGGGNSGPWGGSKGQRRQGRGEGATGRGQGVMGWRGTWCRVRLAVRPVTSGGRGHQGRCHCGELEEPGLQQGHCGARTPVAEGHCGPGSSGPQRPCYSILHSQPAGQRSPFRSVEDDLGRWPCLLQAQSRQNPGSSWGELLQL